MKIVHFNQLCRTFPYSWNFDPYIIFLFFIWWEALIKFSSFDTIYLEYTPWLWTI